MEELWNGVHQSSLQDFLSRGSIPVGPKDKDLGEKQADKNEAGDKNEMYKKEFLNTLNTPGFISSLNSPFDALATVAVTPSATSLLSTCFSIKNKRMSEDQNIVDGEIGVHRRHKRMMKNRESAARSRARRQAYTSQLEREHAKLKEENAKLRKQQQMLSPSVPTEMPRKRGHSRSSTAPL